MLWLAKIVPIGDALPWTNVGVARFGAVKPTRNVIHHGFDWTLVLSTTAAQKPCGPYWSAVGVKSNDIW